LLGAMRLLLGPVLIGGIIVAQVARRKCSDQQDGLSRSYDNPRKTPFAKGAPGGFLLFARDLVLGVSIWGR
jgi:hypothetical protein